MPSSGPPAIALASGRCRGASSGLGISGGQGARGWAFSMVAPQISVPREASAAQHTGKRHRCREIGGWARAQELLRQGRTYLDRDEDGVACESLR